MDVLASAKTGGILHHRQQNCNKYLKDTCKLLSGLVFLSLSHLDGFDLW